jgi:DNA mismatch endonuclease (patch repair protein)
VPDIVDAATRSRMMSGIRAKNTRPEIALRKALHRRGFRYALHPKDVPGKPDLVFRSRSAAILVHGCFWHGHDCKFFRLPGTRQAFWKGKIEGNAARDKDVRAQLLGAGWRTLVVWECATRGQGASAIDSVANRVATWLRSDKKTGVIRGR